MNRWRRASGKAKTGVLAGALVLAGGAGFVATRSTAPAPTASPTPTTTTRVLSGVTTRVVVQGPTGTVIPCGGSATSIGSVLVRTFATSAIGGQQNFRWGHGIADERAPGGFSESWYPIWRQPLPAGQEKEFGSFVQHLNQGGLHRFGFGLETPGATTRCEITFNNVPPLSEGLSQTRPVPEYPVAEVRLRIFEYGDGNGNGVHNEHIPCGSVWRAGRIRVDLEARAADAGYHTFHFHQERVNGTGPDRQGDGIDREDWSQDIGDIFVPGGNVWTKVNKTHVMQAGGVRKTVHLAEGPRGFGVEAFCSFTSSS